MKTLHSLKTNLKRPLPFSNIFWPQLSHFAADGYYCDNDEIDDWEHTVCARVFFGEGIHIECCECTEDACVNRVHFYCSLTLTNQLICNSCLAQNHPDPVSNIAAQWIEPR